MATRQSAHLSVEQCAEIADLRTAARQPELISAFICEGICPEDVRHLLAKPTTASAKYNAEQLNIQVLEEAAAERFCMRRSPVKPR